MDFRIVLSTCVALTAMCRASHAQVDAARLQPGVDSLARSFVGETTRTETLWEDLRIQQRDDGRRVVLVLFANNPNAFPSSSFLDFFLDVAPITGSVRSGIRALEACGIVQF